MSKFIALNLDLIEEGDFMAEANIQLGKLQEQLIAYRDKHQMESKGAKGKLTMEITVKIEDPKDELFSIKSSIKKALPARPSYTSLAMANKTQDGQARLFVRESGSTADSPRQSVLCTEAGEMVDQTEPEE